MTLQKNLCPQDGFDPFAPGFLVKLDRAEKIVEVRDGQRWLAIFRGRLGNLVDAVVYSPDGMTLASCSHDGTIRFWNPSDGKQTAEVKLQAQPLYCLAWRPDGKQVAVGSFDRSVRLIDVNGKKVEREIKGFDEKSFPNGHREAVYSVAYTPDGQQLY